MNSAQPPGTQSQPSSAQDASFFDLANPSNRRSFLLLGLGALLGLGIAGYGLFTAAGTATRSVPPEYVALVNHRPIYRSDYLTQLQATYTVTFKDASAEQKQQVLQDMINEELLIQRALEADLPSYDPEVRNTLVAGVELQMYASILAKQPTDAELRSYYEQHRDKYSTLGLVQLRDLMLNYIDKEAEADTKKRAEQAVAALRAGQAVDAVMQQYKLRDSLRLQQNGVVDLGEIFEFAAEAKLPPQVYAATKKLDAGMVSNPVEVPGDGLHIVTVLKRSQSQPMDFTAVRSNVWNDMTKDAQQKVRESTLKYLRNKSEILTNLE